MQSFVKTIGKSFFEREELKLKPMLPTLSFDLPEGTDWHYEVKYDGFRVFLLWDEQGIQLISRNGNDLIPQFPEIKTFLICNKTKLKQFLPFIIDGELVILENPYKADFTNLQKRGRMKSMTRIEKIAKNEPARILAFDLLKWKGKEVTGETYLTRKQMLTSLFTCCQLPLEPTMENQFLQLVPAELDYHLLWNRIVLYDGEGIVAKKRNSLWESGKRSTEWIKYKNWKFVNAFIISYHKSNGFFHLGVYKNDSIYVLGQFKNGLSTEETTALLQIMKENKVTEDNQFIYVNPAICLKIKYLSIYEGKLREAYFHTFLFDFPIQNCTFDNFIRQQKNMPTIIQITHSDKMLWKKDSITKIEYIHYLQNISAYMLPYLKNRALTIIRYPHGMFGEPFYQKNCPDYAPTFIQKTKVNGIDYILCNDLESLVWLGNQLAIEFHVPFAPVHHPKPSEIMFDLDPPSQDEFSLAIRAALMIKELFDSLQLTGFIKTSGNKGLQIYLPLPENRYSYEETRLFTTFIAHYLVSKDPKLFTIERLKNKRGKRLYIDYMQHAEGKTIIAPYSLRGTQLATVATPLFWEEVNEQLHPATFRITNVLDRLHEKGCPFQTFFTVKEKQKFAPVLSFLKEQQQ